MDETKSYECRCCGASVAIDATQCDYCHNPVTISSFASLRDISPPIINKYVGNYQSALSSGGDRDDQIALGLCYLKLKLYQKACQTFEQAQEGNFENSEPFFYAAVSKLAGKKAFLAKRPDIDKALEFLDAALMIEPKAIYHYFLSYIKYDFFSRKGYKIEPDYEEDLATATEAGLPDGDVQYLYEILSIERPSEL